MEEKQRAAILVDLCERLDSAGSWCGETHIQKSLFFVQDLTGVPTGFKFILYKFGPFSFDLRESLNVLVADKLLSIRVKAYPYGPSYLPADAGRRLVDGVGSDVGGYARQVEFVAGKLGRKGVADLERLATALFIWRRQSESWANLEQEIHRIKPHVTLEKAGAAVEELKSIVAVYQEQGSASAIFAR